MDTDPQREGELTSLQRSSYSDARYGVESIREGARQESVTEGGRTRRSAEMKGHRMSVRDAMYRERMSAILPSTAYHMLLFVDEHALISRGNGQQGGRFEETKLCPLHLGKVQTICPRRRIEVR